MVPDSGVPSSSCMTSAQEDTAAVPEQEPGLSIDQYSTDVSLQLPRQSRASVTSSSAYLKPEGLPISSGALVRSTDMQLPAKSADISHFMLCCVCLNILDTR